MPPTLYFETIYATSLKFSYRPHVCNLVMRWCYRICNLYWLWCIVSNQFSSSEKCEYIVLKIGFAYCTLCSEIFVSTRWFASVVNYTTYAFHIIDLYYIVLRYILFLILYRTDLSVLLNHQVRSIDKPVIDRNGNLLF